MAPKRENVSLLSSKKDPQFFEDLKQQIYDGYRAQKTELDKIRSATSWSWRS